MPCTSLLSNFSKNLVEKLPSGIKISSAQNDSISNNYEYDIKIMQIFSNGAKNYKTPIRFGLILRRYYDLKFVWRHQNATLIFWVLTVSCINLSFDVFSVTLRIKASCSPSLHLCKSIWCFIFLVHLRCSLGPYH